MSVVVRFAPSPTGYLHIGGARTALFNWLFARHHKGKYLLRIEDTDPLRSTKEAVDAILDGLHWLGLDPDEPPIFQSTRFARHREVALRLLAEGKAYRCYATPEELEAMREKARAEGRPMRYDGRWRDRDPSEAPPGVPPVIRFKAPRTGETVIEDLVQGTVRVANEQLDDMVLLRSDGTPTYMLSVVVDDIDMGITHIIRGHDHLTNAFRQKQLYDAIGAPCPAFAHIPLIHGPDGTKLSKRHGALSVTEYRAMGFLPEAMRCYLLRLGWSYGDKEFFTDEEAIALFDLSGVGRSPSRFDMAKLLNVNAHFLRLKSDAELLELVRPFLADLGLAVEGEGARRLAAGMAGLKARARTLVELARGAAFYLRPRPLPVQAEAAQRLDPTTREALAALVPVLREQERWEEAALEASCRGFAEARGLKFATLAQAMRAALTGSLVSPGLFEVMVVLGKEEVLGRLEDAAAGRNPVAEGAN
ncbi:MAG: glutamate--tRNA ligase [Geminicoccaceae bacterium]|nr:glutamate--tRNA ligase [Geminicoccaceae bacterium]MDW8124624.1 glutamate--tRNA ligase [Geminicoccaceae bacterium]